MGAKSSHQNNTAAKPTGEVSSSNPVVSSSNPVDVAASTVSTPVGGESDKKDVEQATRPLLRIVPTQPKRWIGIQLDTTTGTGFHHDTWLATSGIPDGEILEIPTPHLTLLFGVTPDGWTTAHDIIESASLHVGDIVFETIPSLIEPTHTPDRSYWCLHVIASASPKLIKLIETLRAKVPTPGERADHLVLPHVTCLVVKRAHSTPALT